MDRKESIESVNDSLQSVIASSQCPRVVFFGDTRRVVFDFDAISCPVEA
jgi:hypothetical protein